MEEGKIGYSKVFKSGSDSVKKFLNGADKNFINLTKRILRTMKTSAPKCPPGKFNAVVFNSINAPAVVP